MITERVKLAAVIKTLSSKNEHERSLLALVLHFADVLNRGGQTDLTMRANGNVSMLSVSNGPMGISLDLDVPQFLALLNIDQNKTITYVEYPDMIGFNPSHIQNLVDQTLSQTLKRIPIQQIYAFQLEKDKKIQQMFHRKKTPFKMSLAQFLNQLGDIRAVLSSGEEQAQEYFVKYPDYWFGGMFLLEYSFFIIVSAQVDIDHLKYQMMSMFEFFSQTIS